MPNSAWRTGSQSARGWRFVRFYCHPLFLSLFFVFIVIICSCSHSRAGGNPGYSTKKIGGNDVISMTNRKNSMNFMESKTLKNGGILLVRSRKKLWPMPPFFRGGPEFLVDGSRDVPYFPDTLLFLFQCFLYRTWIRERSRMVQMQGGDDVGYPSVISMSCQRSRCAVIGRPAGRRGEDRQMHLFVI